ncbi:MAG: FAD binding domain-containing protein [Anaerolineae bacterium]|nr:FAD binding domain-containing protein [Anaerolineae bacterium]
MVSFSYVRAENITQAVRLLNESGIKSRPLAGGTDLMLLLRADPLYCQRVVDITQIKDLHAISRTEDQISIGAAATFSEVIKHPLIAENVSLLVQACRQVGATQIRNLGTLGGNVANAAACADSLPALVCLDAVAKVITPEGELEWPVAQLVSGPNRTLIPPGGLLVSLSFRIPQTGSKGIFLKLGRRNAMAISRLTVAALGHLDQNGRIDEARLAPGSASPQILRFSAVENHLLGQYPNRELYQSAGVLATEEMTRLTGKRWSSEFKIPALSALVARAFEAIFEPELTTEAAR